MSGQVRKLIASLMLIFIFVTVGAVLLDKLADSGVYDGLIKNMVKGIPFGNDILKFIDKLAVKFYSSGVTASKYISGDTDESTFGFFKSFCKLCLNGVIFGIFTYVADEVLGLGSGGGILGFIYKTVWHMFCAVVSTVVVNIMISLVFDQIEAAGGVVGMIGSYLVSLSVLGGALAFTILKYSLNLLQGVLCTILKYVLTNVVSLVVTEVAMMMILIALSAKLYLYVIEVAIGWMFILVILVGIGMMIDTAMKKL